MGIRFKKSVKIAPGVRVNIGKKSVGMSVGGKYGGMSFNSKTGARARASVPGAGVSYSKKVGSGSSSATSNTHGNQFISPKSKYVALILCILLGYLGIHRFYAGKIGTGIVWFFTAGAFVIGWLYDIAKIATGTFTDGNGLIIR